MTDALDHVPACRLPPLHIGAVHIEFPVVQAALSGYSDWAMRMIARRHGAPYASCEVMLDQFLLQVRRRARTRHFFHLTDDDHPVAGQLMGAEPQQFAAGAVRLVEAGFAVEVVAPEVSAEITSAIAAAQATEKPSSRELTSGSLRRSDSKISRNAWPSSATKEK